MSRYAFVMDVFMPIQVTHSRACAVLIKQFGIVGDPDPQDPHVFGPPRSGSISQEV